MSFGDESDYEKETRWREDVRRFAWAFVKHWEGWVAFVLSGAVAAIFQWHGRFTVISPWALCAVISLGVMVAAFKTWRDQKRIAEAKATELDEAKAGYAEQI